MKVRGAVDRGMKDATGLGEPLYGAARGVGEDAEEVAVVLPAQEVTTTPWPPPADTGTTDTAWTLTGPADTPEYGDEDLLGDKLRPPSVEPTASIGLKHWASGLKVLVTSRSAEESSCGSASSLNRTLTAPFSPMR